MAIIKNLLNKNLLILAIIFLLGACSLEKIISSETASQSRRQAAPKTSKPVLKPVTSNYQISQGAPKIIQKKVKIAALLPLSGKNKDLGAAMLNSVILSLFENDKNNDIELVVFDSKDGGADSKKAIADIAAQNIKVVIGPIFSSDVEAVADVAKDNKITILSISNNQDLAGKAGVFLMGFLPEQQIEKLSAYAIANGRDNIAIIAPNNQYGSKFSQILREMVQRKDGNLISTELYNNGHKDLERAVAKTLNANIIPPRLKNKIAKNILPQDRVYASAIVVPESGMALSKIAALIKKINVSERDIKIIGSSNWDNLSTFNDPNLLGSWFVAANPNKYRDFEKRYYQTYNKFPPRISSIGYDAAIAAIEVVKKSANREKLSPEDFINYQSSKNAFEGLDGLLRFLPNGIVQRNFAILEVKNGKFEMIDSPNTTFFKY